VIEPGGGDVADAPAGPQMALLPLLLITAPEAAVHVEGADRPQRGGADRQIRAPRTRDVAVLRPEVHARDRRPLAAADGARASFEAGADGAGEDADVGVGRGGGDERVEPAFVHLDVVVDEDEQLARGRGGAGVAGGVEPARLAQGQVARAEAPGQLGVAREGAVVDDDHLGARTRGLGEHRGQRHLEVGGAVAGGDDDRGGRWHHSERV
jgi:hypothetical protein